jgi:hypothetical protein
MPSSKRVTPITIQKYLKGIKYPVAKKQLIDQADKNSAPTDVMEILNKIADKKYQTSAEVSKGIGAVD